MGELFADQVASSHQLLSDGTDNDPYVEEHANLIASIRNGHALNEGEQVARSEGEQVARSTMGAIAGRVAASTGRSMEWDWALYRSQLDLSSPAYEFGDLPVAPPATPGLTGLV